MKKKYAASRRQEKAKQEKRRNRMMFMAGGLGLVLAGILLWLGSQSSAASSAPVLIEPGQPAPNFELTTLAGETAVLEDYAGDVVLINFWATWCPPCKAEMPAIQAYYAANQANGLTVLGVNAQEDKNTVSRFIEANGFTFPILLDSQGDVASQFQVRSYPTTLVVDRTGTIHTIHNGLITMDQLESIVTPLLSG